VQRNYFTYRSDLMGGAQYVGSLALHHDW
jgi:hypothetical protein